MAKHVTPTPTLHSLLSKAFPGVKRTGPNPFATSSPPKVPITPQTPAGRARDFRYVGAPPTPPPPASDNQDRTDKPLIVSIKPRPGPGPPPFHPNPRFNTPSPRQRPQEELPKDAVLERAAEAATLVAPAGSGPSAPPVFYVDTEAGLTALLKLISGRATLFVDCHGGKLGRGGTLDLMVIYPHPVDAVYLIAVHALDRAAFELEDIGGRSLRKILERETTLKVGWDLRRDADVLNARHGINMRRVCDLQMLECLVRPRNASLKKLANLRYALEQLARAPADEVADWAAAKEEGKKLWDPALGGSVDAFRERPLPPPEIVRCCVADVRQLPRLYDALLGIAPSGAHGLALRVSRDRLTDAISEDNTDCDSHLSTSGGGVGGTDGGSSHKRMTPWACSAAAWVLRRVLYKKPLVFLPEQDGAVMVQQFGDGLAPVRAFLVPPELGQEVSEVGLQRPILRKLKKQRRLEGQLSVKQPTSAAWGAGGGVWKAAAPPPPPQQQEQVAPEAGESSARDDIVAPTGTEARKVSMGTGKEDGAQEARARAVVGAPSGAASDPVAEAEEAQGGEARGGGAQRREARDGPPQEPKFEQEDPERKEGKVEGKERFSFFGLFKR